MHKVHPLAWQAEPTNFALTHCMKCEGGWTRRGANGVKIIVCLLDQEPVLPNMTGCDRYLQREEDDPHQLNLMAKGKPK